MVRHQKKFIKPSRLLEGMVVTAVSNNEIFAKTRLGVKLINGLSVGPVTYSSHHQGDKITFKLNPRDEAISVATDLRFLMSLKNLRRPQFAVCFADESGCHLGNYFFKSGATAALLVFNEKQAYVYVAHLSIKDNALIEKRMFRYDLDAELALRIENNESIQREKVITAFTNWVESEYSRLSKNEAGKTNAENFRNKHLPFARLVAKAIRASIPAISAKSLKKDLLLPEACKPTAGTPPPDKDATSNGASESVSEGESSIEATPPPETSGTRESSKKAQRPRDHRGRFVSTYECAKQTACA